MLKLSAMTVKTFDLEYLKFVLSAVGWVGPV